MMILRGVLILLILVWTGTAVSTVIPSDNASKANRMGYKSICSYTPISTAILVSLAVVTVGVGFKFGVF